MSVASLRKPLISNALFGMIVFVLTEIMFFTALISAYLVIKSSKGSWVPPGNIRLPIETTAVNSFILLLSGFFLWRAGRRLSQEQVQEGQKLLWRAFLLGLCFLLFQGYEWVQLIGYGMSWRSGIFGACFFLLVGSHALHVFAGVALLGRSIRKVQQECLELDSFFATQLFWYFVVLLWPILYFLVYF